jgi:phage shock protein PspC (stress-responsive transcriptional regulator)
MAEKHHRSMTEDRPPADSTSPTPLDEPSAGTGGPTPPADDLPPLTAFALRNGLVRPVRGRVVAGVCGALARATKTDPVLWRVIMVVLTIFGGIGVLLYLLGWLLLPADGDTATPTEALAGRGRSGTSATMTIIVGIVALLLFGAAISAPFRPGLLVAAVLGGALLLLLRDQRGRGVPATAPSSLTPSGQPPRLADLLRGPPRGRLPCPGRSFRVRRVDPRLLRAGAGDNRSGADRGRLAGPGAWADRVGSGDLAWLGHHCGR